MNRRSNNNALTPRHCLSAKPASANIVVFARDGSLLAVKATNRREWTLPGGLVEVGESPREAAARELLEETGIRVSSSELRMLYIFYTRSDGERYNFTYTTSLPNGYMRQWKFRPTNEIEQCRFMSRDEFSRTASGRPSAKFLISLLKCNQMTEVGYGEEEKPPKAMS